MLYDFHWGGVSILYGAARLCLIEVCGFFFFAET